MTVGIRELKNKLSSYVARAKRGEQIIVTERGKPVALLKNIEAAKPSDTLEAQLARAAAHGLLTLPAGKPLRKFKPVKASGPPASQIIIEGRR